MPVAISSSLAPRESDNLNALFPGTRPIIFISIR
jgi:hypothetical protein